MLARLSHTSNLRIYYAAQVVVALISANHQTLPAPKLNNAPRSASLANPMKLWAQEIAADPWSQHSGAKRWVKEIGKEDTDEDDDVPLSLMSMPVFSRPCCVFVWRRVRTLDT